MTLSYIHFCLSITCLQSRHFYDYSSPKMQWHSQGGGGGGGGGGFTGITNTFFNKKKKKKKKKIFEAFLNFPTNDRIS